MLAQNAIPRPARKWAQLCTRWQLIADDDANVSVDAAAEQLSAVRGLLARQWGRSGRLELRPTAVADDATGDRYRLFGLYGSKAALTVNSSCGKRRCVQNGR